MNELFETSELYFICLFVVGLFFFENLHCDTQSQIVFRDKRGKK